MQRAPEEYVKMSLDDIIKETKKKAPKKKIPSQVSKTMNAYVFHWSSSDTYKRFQHCIILFFNPTVDNLKRRCFSVQSSNSSAVGKRGGKTGARVKADEKREKKLDTVSSRYDGVAKSNNILFVFAKYPTTFLAILSFSFYASWLEAEKLRGLRWLTRCNLFFFIIQSYLMYFSIRILTAAEEILW